jgi:hypothetical protein
MKSNSLRKCVLALVLVGSIVTTACTGDWIKVALADLPVVTEMALNIASLVTALQSGQQVDAADAANIQNISHEAATDLGLLSSLYTDYKSNPTPNTMLKIQQVIATLNTNLPALLSSAHIKDAALAARVSAGVTLILETVDTFAALIPQSAASLSTARSASRTNAKLPRPQDLRNSWNSQVCAPTGKAQFDSALSACYLSNAAHGSKLGDAFGDWFQNGR